MEDDTADTSLTSSASKSRTKAKSKTKAIASSSSRPAARPSLQKSTSSNTGGKVLTMAQQTKEAERAEAEERIVPWRFLQDVKDVRSAIFPV